MYEYERFRAQALYLLGRSGGSTTEESLLDGVKKQIGGIDPLDLHLGLRRLRKEHLVEPHQGWVFLTDRGWDWLAANRHKLVTKPS